MIKTGETYTIKTKSGDIEVKVKKIFRDGEIWLVGEDYNNMVSVEEFKILTGQEPGLK
jgi:hypothetical protein